MNLNQIQKELKAPKDKYNSFGKYKYRSCESILESVKPLLGESTLTLTDEIVEVGGRIYVKAIAKFVDEKETIVTAFAREPAEKKGMDESQITGTASSYARKYALNGLFLIDDTKDADTDEFHNVTNKEPKLEEEDNLNEPISAIMQKRISEIIKLNKTEEQSISLATDLYKEFKVKKLAELTNSEYGKVLKWLEGK